MHPLGLNFSSLDCSLTEKGFLRNRHEEVIGWLYFCHILLLELKSKSWDVRVTIRFRFIKESDKKRTLLMGFTDDFKVQIFLGEPHASQEHLNVNRYSRVLFCGCWVPMENTRGKGSVQGEGGMGQKHLPPSLFRLGFLKLSLLLFCTV